MKAFLGTSGPLPPLPEPGSWTRVHSLPSSFTALLCSEVLDSILAWKHGEPEIQRLIHTQSLDTESAGCGIKQTRLRVRLQAWGWEERTRGERTCYGASNELKPLCSAKESDSGRGVVMCKQETPGWKETGGL